MDINLRKASPCGKDEQAKQHIKQNWAVIEKLAEQISFGRASVEQSRRPPPPQAKSKIIVDQAARAAPQIVGPNLQIRVNDQLVTAELSSGRHLRLIGQIKPIGGVMRFVAATKENGFYSPLDDDTYALIDDLANMIIDQEFSEQDLEQELQTRLTIT